MRTAMSVFFCSAGEQTLGFVYTSHALCQLSYVPGIFYYFIIFFVCFYIETGSYPLAQACFE